ncbi:hypothetical protein BG910_07860 [Neisseria chenwenguii]|uniref:Adhesin n=2 Tax=Neisseria chenwenguii TaxID=1853278 RepID=A0A220S2S0_9NEIS|nr:hypothetical protein BG910_07860 [Neisseria chenwenguii]
MDSMWLRSEPVQMRDRRPVMLLPSVITLLPGKVEQPHLGILHEQQIRRQPLSALVHNPQGYMQQQPAHNLLPLDLNATAIGGANNEINATTASGNYSIAVGFGAKSTAAGTTAVGTNANASVVGATALGSGAAATRIGAIAISSTDDNAAINDKTTASADYALAVGNTSTASGKMSVAVGSGAKATAGNALAAGTGANAQGEQSIAIGDNAQATAKWTTAIGQGVLANAEGAQAFGVSSQATAQNAAAIGRWSIATAARASAFGVGNTASGASALSLGDQAVASGGNSIAAGTEAKASDTDSIAIGRSSNASGLRAIVIGSESAATNPNTVVVGNNASAGRGTAVAVGYQAQAKDGRSIAIGESSTAGVGLQAGATEEEGRLHDSTFSSAIAIGYQSQSTNVSTVAISREAKASGERAVAVGFQTSAAENSTAVGSQAKATAARTLAMGDRASASADEAVASGVLANASGKGAFALGSNTVASGENSVAAGKEAKATGAGGTALGTGTSAASAAIAAGQDAKANGWQSTAVGNAATAGSSAAAVGAGANASGTYSTALGYKAIAGNTSSVALGDGAHTLGVSSLAFGTGSQAVGTSAVAIGNTAQANQADAMALGTRSVAAKTSSLAIGSNAKATEVNAVALGSDTSVTQSNGVALGKNSVANRAAIGNAPSTSATTIRVTADTAPTTVYANTNASSANIDAVKATATNTLAGVSVGSATQNRQITGVAAGSADNDAVNVSQLRAVADVAASAAGGFTLTASATSDGQLGNAASVSDNVSSGDTVTFEADKNIKLTQADEGNRKITIATKDDVSFTSVTAGTGASAVTLNGNGVAVGGNTYISDAGLNANNKVISNVAAGKAAGDAANVGQLSKIAEAVGLTFNNNGMLTTPSYTTAGGKTATSVQGALDNLGTTPITFKADTGRDIPRTLGTDLSIKGGSYTGTSSADNIVTHADGTGVVTIKMADAPTFAGKLTADGLDAGSEKITNVATGDVLQNSTDAVNGGQLYAQGKGVADILGNTVYDPATGTYTNTDIGGTGASNINDAIKAVNTAADSKLGSFTVGADAAATAAGIEVGKADNRFDIVGEDGVTTKVDDRKITVGLGDSITVGGITVNGAAAGGNVISGLGNTLAEPASTTSQAVPAFTGNEGSRAASVTDVLNAGWNVQGNGQAVDFVKAYDAVNFVDGTGTTVEVASDGNATTTVKVNVDAQKLAETAQLPVVYTKADGTKVYKEGGKFYTDLNDKANSEVAAGDVIASMQNADGTTTAPTTLANVKAGSKDNDAVNVSQLKGAADALGGGAAVNSDGSFKAPAYTLLSGADAGAADKTYNNVGDALAAVDKVANSPLTFAGDSGTPSGRKLGSTVTVKGGVTDTAKLSDGNIGVVSDGNGTLDVKLAKDVKVDSVTAGGTKIDSNGLTFVDAQGTKVSDSPSITAKSIDAGNQKVANVQNGDITQASKEAVNGSQLYDVDQKAETNKTNIAANAANIAKGINVGGTTGSNQYALGDTINVKGDNNISSETVAGGVQLKLNDSITIGSAGGTNKPVTIDGTQGVISGLSNTLPVTTNTGTPTTKQTAPVLAGNEGSNAATVNDILNAGWNVQGNGKDVDFVKAYDAVNFVDGTGTTVEVASDGNATTTVKVNVDAQKLAETAQLPVVYTKADGTKVYKEGGKFYTDLNDKANSEVAAGDVIASMQNADGKTTTPTTLANVKAGVNNNDAVNVSQLKGAADALGSGAAVNSDGTFKAPEYTLVSGAPSDGTAAKYDNVGAALGALNTAVTSPLYFEADSGSTVESKLGSTVRIVGGNYNNPASADNIITEADAATGTIAIKLADAPTFKGKVTAKGLDAGGEKVTNVGAGNVAADSQDAVNGSQLFAQGEGVKNIIGGNTTYNPATGAYENTDIGGTGKGNVNDAIESVNTAAKAAKTEVKQGDNIEVTSEEGANGQTVYTVKTAKDLVVDSVTSGDTVVNNGGVTVGKNVALTSDGLTAGGITVNSNTNVISGLNAGTVAADSKDAVNGSQLFAAADAAKTYLGGNAVVNPNGTVSTADIGGTGKDNVHDAIASVNATANAGWKLTAQGQNGSQVAPNDTVDLNNADGNIVISKTADADNVTFNLAKDVKVDSVTAGNTVVNSDGLKVGKVVISKDGLDNGGNKVTNVAAGAVSADSTDAVNGGQLYQVYQVIGSNGATVNTTTPRTDAGTGTSNVGNIKGITLVDNSNNPNVTNVTNNTRVAESNGYTLTTYNVEDRGMYVTNNVIEAVGRMNEQGIKFFHTNDSSVDPATQATNTEDSSASGAYASAIGYQSVASGSNAVAVGKGSQALAENTIAIGTGNIVSGKNSGAIGDPSTVSGSGSYSFGNDNTVATDNAFVVGNNVTQTLANSVILGNESAATAVNKGSYTYKAENENGVAGKDDVVGVVSVGAAGKTRQIQNVAAGVVSATSTDAVNGSQLYYTNKAVEDVAGNVTALKNGGAGVVQYSNADTPVTANGGVPSNDVTLAGADKNAPVVIHNVGEGRAPTDAVNVNQLARMGDALQNNIHNVGRKAYAGVAGAIAQSSIPQVTRPGATGLGIGGGYYGGESAMAIGVSSMSDGGNWIVKGNFSTNTGGHMGVGAGALYQW